jgi:hypothetical protein
MHTKKLFTFIFLSIFSVASIASNSDISKDNELGSTLASSLQKLGEGQMNILFWKVYKAEFYSANSPYNEKTYPKALKLTYQRDIEKQEFIDATQGEWVKLNANFSERLIPQVQEDKWLTQLSDIFPDIKEDDVFLFTLSKEKQANFYLKAASNSEGKSLDYQLLGSINEPTFGDYFLSIWLSEKTSEPKLRKKLIGQ